MQISLSYKPSIFPHKAKEDYSHKEFFSDALYANTNAASFKGNMNNSIFSRLVHYFSQPINSKKAELSIEEIETNKARKRAKNALKSIVYLLNENTMNEIDKRYFSLYKEINRFFGPSEKGEKVKKHIIKASIKNPLQNPNQRAEVLFQTFITNSPDKIVKKLIEYNQEKKKVSHISKIIKQQKQAKAQAIQSAEYKQTISTIKTLKKEIAVLKHKIRQDNKPSRNLTKLEAKLINKIEEKDILKAKLKDIIIQYQIKSEN